jgi:hypothetical protein
MLKMRRGSLGGALAILALAWWAPASAWGDTVSDERTTTVPTSQSTTDVDATGTVDAQVVVDLAPADPAAPAPNPIDAGSNPPAAPGPTAPQPDGAALPGANQPAGDATSAPAPKKPNQPCNTKPAPTSKNQSPAGNATPSPATKNESPAGNATRSPATKNESPAGSGATQATSSDRPPSGTQAAAPPPTSMDAETAPGQAPSTPVAPPPVFRSPILAHQLDRPSAPRAALTPPEPVVVANHRESPRLVVVLAAIRPTTTSLLRSPPPLFAQPNSSPTPPPSSAREAAGPTRVHKSKPAPASHEDPERAPVLPSGPPTRDPAAVASSATAAGGAPSAGMWSAVLVAFLLYATLGLRRNRAPLLLAGPAGVSSPQQRPG